MPPSSPTNNPEINESRLRKSWPMLLLIGACVWFAAILATLYIPGDPKNQLILGLSATRLGLLAVILAIAILEGSLAWLARRKPAWRKRYLDPLVTRPVLFHAIVLLLIGFTTMVWLGSLLFTSTGRVSFLYTQFSVYYARVLPFLIAFVIEMLVLLVGLFLLRNGLMLDSIAAAALREERGLWLGTFFLYSLFLIVWILMAVTGVGITEDVVGWGQPGVPLLFYQVLFAWLAGMALLGLGYHRRSNSLDDGKNKSSRSTVLLDILVILLIWGVTCWLWTREPLQRSYFTLPSGIPNFETYPYSDAALYDTTAQSIQVGSGFLDGQVTPRPIYALLLAIFHAIAGQKYDDVIFLQVLILAFFPVFIYLIGRELHSRPSGLILAGLAVIREITTILSTQEADVSHSKLFMSDVPTALAIAALTWLTIRWLKQPFSRWLEALLAGGVLGITILIRTQAIILLPFIGLVVLLGYYSERMGRMGTSATSATSEPFRRYWKKLVVPGLIFCLGLVLTISPWLVRNYAYTGSWAMDDPTYAGGMYVRYVVDLGEEVSAQLPNETQEAYSERMTAAAKQMIRTRPDLVARFMTAHFFNNIVSTVLVLPLRFSLTDGCNTLVLCSTYWISLIQQFSPTDALLAAINLFLIAFGIASTWRRWRAIGLLPLFIFLGYNISNILLRNSGRRYILPVDWVGYLYFIIGLVDLALWGSRLFGSKMERIQGMIPAWDDRVGLQEPSKKNYHSLVPAGVILLLIGLSLPLSEIIVPKRYPQASKTQLIERLAEFPATRNLPFESAALENFLAQEAVIRIGRALYPRYYPEGKGEPGTGQPAYQPYEYRSTKKIGFILVGPGGSTQVNLALEQAPNNFANASDVIVVGCQENGYVDALLVVFLDESGRIILRTGPDDLTCPLR